MKTCPYCNADINDDAALCTNCGKAVTAQPVAPAQPGAYQQSAAPAQPAATTEPVAPTVPAATAEPVAPAQPGAYQQPVAPAQPGAYQQPAAPAQPGAYQQPAAPYGAYQPPQAKKGGLKWWHILLIVVAALTAAAVAFVAVFAVFAQGDTKKFAGKWETTVDAGSYIGDSFNESLGSDADEFEGYFDIDSFKVKMFVEFKDDGTYKFWIDKDTFENSFNDYIDTLKSGLYKYFDDSIKKEGLDMTVDQLLALSGLDLDAYVDELIDMDDILGELDDSTVEGEYTAYDGKLFMTDGSGKEFDDSEYLSYEFNGKDEFKVISATDGTLFDFGDDFLSKSNPFPITFSKVG